METILYSYYRSSCSYRVRIALNWKKIPFTYKSVNLLKNEQSSDEYGTVNPSHVVPTLQIDGHHITQSLSILEYLEDSRPELPALLPKDPFQRSLVRTIMNIIACDIQPVQNLKILAKIEAMSGPQMKMNWGKEVIVRGFKALESVLEKSSGKYCVGDSVTLADICLVPQIYNARRFSVDLVPFPNISRIESALNNLDAFKKAHPNEQPDCPQDQKV